MTRFQTLVDQAIAAIDGAADLAALNALRPTLVGKKAPLADASRSLAAMDEQARKQAGRELNAARQAVQSHLDIRTETLRTESRRAQYEAERMDLTEVRGELRRGHLHLVTQARDRLEDLFVGMGYTIAEGPEVETAWYNFEALNIPEWHPARGEFDTIFVDLGEPEEVMLRSHTSPGADPNHGDTGAADLHRRPGPDVPHRRRRCDSPAGVQPDRGPGGRQGNHLR